MTIPLVPSRHLTLAVLHAIVTVNVDPAVTGLELEGSAVIAICAGALPLVWPPAGVVTLKAEDVAAARPASVAMIVYPSSGLLMVRVEKMATPLLTPAMRTPERRPAGIRQDEDRHAARVTWLLAFPYLSSTVKAIPPRLTRGSGAVPW